jgi:hypothetical protein
MDVAYCQAEVVGRTYQELDLKAREYGANFFEVPVEEVSVFLTTHAVVNSVSKHADDPTLPEQWKATFRIGCIKEVDEIAEDKGQDSEDHD